MAKHYARNAARWPRESVFDAEDLDEIPIRSFLIGAPNILWVGKLCDFREITGCVSKIVQGRCSFYAR